MSEAGGSGRPGVILAVVGGLMTAGGVFLSWGKAAISMPGVGVEHYDVAGTDLGNGPVVMGLGIAVVVAALLALALRGKPLAALTAIATVAGGLLAAILGIVTFTGLKDAMIDPIVEQSGVPLESFNDAARKILSDAMTVGSGWGLYLSILGGFVAACGGVLLLMSVRRDAAQAAEQAPEEVADPRAEDAPAPVTVEGEPPTAGAP